MAHVAREMERRGLTLPLLIGGATTSRQHTAVKIAPEYGGVTVYVADASRVTDVVSSLLNPAARTAFEQATRDEQEALRRRHQAARRAPLLAYPAALANRLVLDWASEPPPAPCFIGRRDIADQPADALRPVYRLDLLLRSLAGQGPLPRGPRPPASTGPPRGSCTSTRRRCSSDLVAHGSLRAAGAYGFWPAESDGEDIVLFQDAERTRVAARFPMLRQQEIVDEGRPTRSLADFVRARGRPARLRRARSP